MAAPWAQGARVRLIGKIHGQETVNVWHFASNVVVNDGDPNALVLALLEACLVCVTEQLLPFATQVWEVVGLEGVRIAPTLGDPIVIGPNLDSQGQRGPTSCSFESALVQIRTGKGGRSHRGRMFLPPPGEAATTASFIDNAVIADLTAFLTCVAGKFMGAGATEQWRLGVLSRKLLANNPANFDTAFTEATSLVPSKEVAIMSSRKVGRGS